MIFLKSIAARFTARGRTRAKVAKRRVCAKKRETDSAIKYDSVKLVQMQRKLDWASPTAGA